MTLEQLKKLCLANNIPIVRDQTLEEIRQLIQTNKYESVLELGTAYGYSAYAISLINCVKKIVTLELRKSNYDVASNALATCSNVKCVNADAFEYVTNDKFDFIFMDACKSHQDVLFEKYSKNLKDNGIIFIDNIYLKKFNINSLDKLTKNQRHLIERVREFEKYLRNLKDWDIEIKDIDDGYAICRRKKCK
ncbi:MAG: hypothetical protein HUJ52_02625 [Malacoplasma sp.]|nr:hypothetical protein [Malacoplasma sp.]